MERSACENNFFPKGEVFAAQETGDCPCGRAAGPLPELQPSFTDRQVNVLG